MLQLKELQKFIRNFYEKEELIFCPLGGSGEIGEI